MFNKLFSNSAGQAGQADQAPVSQELAARFNRMIGAGHPGAEETHMTQPPEALPTQSEEAAVTRAVIGRDMTIEGAVISQGELQIDGTVRGDVRVGRLTLTRSGVVEGSVNAEVAEIFGRVKGAVNVRQVRLYASSSVEGDVSYEQMGMETGAHFDGRSSPRGARAQALAQAGAREAAGSAQAPVQATADQLPSEPAPAAPSAAAGGSEAGTLAPGSAPSTPAEAPKRGRRAAAATAASAAPSEPKVEVTTGAPELDDAPFATTPAEPTPLPTEDAADRAQPFPGSTHTLAAGDAAPETAPFPGKDEQKLL